MVYDPYKISDDVRKLLGTRRIAPLPRLTSDWTTIARFPKDPETGDGQEVELQCCAWPAKFYRVVAKEGRNSIGDVNPGFTLGTGAGFEAAEWAVKTAELISQGMVGIEDCGGNHDA